MCITFLLLGLLWFFGCSTTGGTAQREASVSDDAADIDELLGLADKKDNEKQDETIAEDDVLKLLGVIEESDTHEAQSAVDSAAFGEGTTYSETVMKETIPPASNVSENAIQTSEPETRTETVPETDPVREKAFPGWKTTTYSERYQEALQDYRSRKYREAIQKFESLLLQNTDHSLSDNCQYWIGESYFGLGNYQQALVAFEKVFSFPRTNKDDDSQLKLGICYMRIQDKEKAKIEFQKLIDNYPSSEYVSIARRYIDQVEM
jgi:tol-pal system protein YbgF